MPYRDYRLEEPCSSARTMWTVFWIRSAPRRRFKRQMPVPRRRSTLRADSDLSGESPPSRWLAAVGIAVAAESYSPGPPAYTLTPEALTIHDRFYPVTLQALIRERQPGPHGRSCGDPDWRPTARTNGFANSHYQSGWFSVANGQKVRLYRAGGSRLVLLPPKGNGAAVLYQAPDSGEARPAPDPRRLDGKIEITMRCIIVLAFGIAGLPVRRRQILRAHVHPNPTSPTCCTPRISSKPKWRDARQENRKDDQRFPFPAHPPPRARPWPNRSS